ncbi:PilZ domain-containing protein [Megalodesulfovibrio paquesii]
MDDSTKHPSPAATGNTSPEAATPAADDPGQQPFRKSFRVPVGDRYALAVQIGGVSYGAFDLVEGGVGIFHSRHAAFSVGQTLEGLLLQFRGDTLSLAGRVVHVFRNEDGMIRYGVEFLDMDAETQARLAEFVRLARLEYLNQQGQHADEPDAR